MQDDQENHELTEYQKHCFLKYGYDEIDGFLDFAGTTAYLAAYGYDHNPLQQVRDKEKAAQEYIRAYDPDKLGAHFCDFCGVEIAGGEGWQRAVQPLFFNRTADRGRIQRCV